MKEIPLTREQVALVDNADFDRVNAFKWYAYRDCFGKWYARRNVRLTNGKRYTVSMHRFITGLERGDPRQVDHKDREATLDNRCQNLRVATPAQNTQNRSRLKNNTSGFIGVYWCKSRWRTQINVEGKRTHVGYFSTPELAAQAYDAAAIEHHKEFAVTNMMLAAAA